ncbi:hypothetical protein KSD_92970 [Ktedonobacter sp. SOSP1-85]|uniref:hypothetical protein n=1 Tax=Ktedonobacter sp. SOSP1-85 TaxID=2778367 RepID=UPI00191550E2|nr:hypothetical protein [Ktedonobacter sp. SOSP1-85]GHO81526.1 hypothetical protein KSD_92970 [Ktedonobacter sp. SOSP1-85]
MSEQQQGGISARKNGASIVDVRAVLDAVQAGQVEKTWMVVRPRKQPESTYATVDLLLIVLGNFFYWTFGALLLYNLNLIKSPWDLCTCFPFLLLTVAVEVLVVWMALSVNRWARKQEQLHANDVLVLTPEGFIDYNPWNDDVIRKIVVFNYAEIERMTVTFLASELLWDTTNRYDSDRDHHLPASKGMGNFKFTIYLKKGIREEWYPRPLFDEPYEIVRRITDDYEKYRQLYGLDD